MDTLVGKINKEHFGSEDDIQDFLICAWVISVVGWRQILIQMH